MIAENKQEFFTQLNVELERLGIEDSEELLADLEEHFAESERRGVPESETCRELGSISEIARSCLDLKSEAINSIVARDVMHKKVSLRKPGRSVPADPSLADGSENGAGDFANSDTVREYTPVHLSEEIYPNANGVGGAENLTNNSTDGSANGAGGFTNNAGSFPNSAGDFANSDTVREYTPVHLSEEIYPNANGVGGAENLANNSADGSANGAGGFANNAGSFPNSAGNFTSNGADGTTGGSANGADGFNNSADNSQNGAGGNGTFERIGRTVDAACGAAGAAVGKAWNKVEETLRKKADEQNFRPSDSYRKNVNRDSHGEIPPQFTKAKPKSGGGFVDTSGLQPNVNFARLLGEIFLDILLWSWLIPVVFALSLAAFCAAIGVFCIGITCLLGMFDFAPYHFITRLLFSLGFLCLTVCLIFLGMLIFKGAVALVKRVFGRHLKAVYNIK